MGKKLLFGILLCICCFNVACGKNDDQADGSSLKLKWLLPAEIEYISKSEEELVEREIGKFFEDMDVEIDLSFLDQDTYVEQVTKILQTEQSWDMLFLNQDLNQVMRNETKKFFAPITDLLHTENAQLYEAIPEYAWDVMTVNKDVYAVPNRHLWAAQEGYYARADYLSEYGRGLNPEKITSFDQIGAFLDEVTDHEKCIGTFVPQNQWEKELLSNEFYFSGDIEELGVIRNTSNGFVVENMFETAEFEAYCKRMRKWYKEEFIRADSAVRDVNAAVISQDKSNGLFALEAINYIEPGMEKQTEEEYGEKYSFKALPTSEIIISPNKVAEYSTAFSVNSEHLAEAMRVVESVYHNEELYNLILYGIEGKHYEKINDRQIQKIPDSGYGSKDAGAVESYVLGNQYLSYVLENESYNKWEIMKDWEQKAKLPETMGFFFRRTNVSDDIRNVSAIIESELRLLETGSVDVDTFLPEFLSKLQEAGADRIIAEYQIQLTRWINNKSEH